MVSESTAHPAGVLAAVHKPACVTLAGVVLAGSPPPLTTALFTTEIPFVPLTFVEITNTLVPPEPAIDAAEAQLISVAFAAVQDQFAADGPLSTSGPGVTDRPGGSRSATETVPEVAPLPLLVTVKV